MTLFIKNRPVISYVFNLNAKWPIKSWSTNYKKKSSFNFVKYVKKKKRFFYQKMTFFTQISKCSTYTILHHPDLELAGQIHFETTEIFHAVLISIYLGNSAGLFLAFSISQSWHHAINTQYSSLWVNDAAHKIPHKMKTQWQNQLNISVLVWFKPLYRISYKKEDVILAQCPFKSVCSSSSYIIAEITKPCVSSFGENDIFLIFVLACLWSSQILYWQNFACQFAKTSYLLNLVTYISCNLVNWHQWMFLCSPEHFPFFEIQGFVISATACFCITVVSRI